MKQTALITGASGGLGAEFARICAADGQDLVLIARSTEKLEMLSKELEKAHGIKVRVIAADLSDPLSIKTIVETCDHESIAVTMLINNAGFGTYGAFATSDAADQHNMNELNVVALTDLTRQLLPGMIERKHGRILNIASTAAFQPGPLMAVYYATKAYVLNFSLALSNELSGSGVTVTCLCPGPTQTGFAGRAKLQKSKLFRRHVMDPRKVAECGYRACMKGKPLVVAGLINKLGTFATRLVPRMFAARIARSAQEQG